MSKGRIEQVGTPLELYRKPANSFVASFIGSPAINLLDATIVTGPTGPCARFADGQEITLETSHQNAIGRTVMAGLRPEHLVPRGPATWLTGTTTLVEPTGAQTHVTFTLAHKTLTAVIDGDEEVAVGHPFAVSVQAERVPIFDQVTGARIN